MIIETGRFGQLNVNEDEIIQIPQGILGFPDKIRYCLVDPGDETLILWLQSLDDPEIAFPMLEPKIFKPDYAARLSAAELRELKLDSINQSAVFNILTIPEDITQMTANLKAPVVVNLKEQLAKQVVLQENEYSIKYMIFKELREHLITINSHKKAEAQATGKPPQTPVSLKAIPPSLTVKSLQP
ncbi:MAG: flagellar assembly protein FliW [Candidatus Poribacteria bacterium]